jgi:hypothetical protein
MQQDTSNLPVNNQGNRALIASTDVYSPYMFNISVV